MSKIFKGAKGKLIINGKVVAEFDSIKVHSVNSYCDIHELKDLTEYVSYRTRFHKCKSCYSEWTFSTNNNKCLKCGSEDIEHFKD